MLARPPVARIHNHIAQRPALVVHDAIFDMPQDAVARLDGEALHLADAAQVGGVRGRSIGRRLPRGGVDGGYGGQARVHASAPQAQSVPVIWVAVVTRVLLLLLPRDRLIGRQARALLYLLP